MREYSIGVPQDLEPVLTEEHVGLLAGIGRPKRLGRGELVYRQGEAAGHVYLLLKGTAQSYLLNARGQESLLRIHLPGSILGLTALATVPWRDASARAVAEVELAVIERERLKQLIAREHGLALRLIQLLVDRMRDFHFRVGDMQAQTVEQRLTRVLLSVSRSDGAGRPASVRSVALTHQELAHLVNASRQSVSAILSRFADAGYVERRGRLTVLKNVPGLQTLLPGAAGPAEALSSAHVS